MDRRGRRTPRAATLALAAAALCCTAHESGATGDNSESLAEALRRQLMRDNYDYVWTEGEAPPPSGRRRGSHRTVPEEVPSDGPPAEENRVQYNDESQVGDLKHDIEGRSGASYPEITKGQDRVNDDNVQRSDRHRTSDGENTAADRNGRTVNYKILKVGASYRRSGGSATLIQEESPDGVSMVNLGGGPFPRFLLPGPRRQYMQGPRGAEPAADHDELPPPPLDTAEDTLETRTGHSTERSTDTSRSAAPATAAPDRDEIFVL